MAHITRVVMRRLAGDDAQDLIEYALLVGLIALVAVIGVIVAVRRQRLKETIAATATLIASRGANAADIDSPRANNRFAYAPAIAIGAILAALRV